MEYAAGAGVTGIIGMTGAVCADVPGPKGCPIPIGGDAVAKDAVTGNSAAPAIGTVDPDGAGADDAAALTGEKADGCTRSPVSDVEDGADLDVDAGAVAAAMPVCAAAAGRPSSEYI